MFLSSKGYLKAHVTLILFVCLSVFPLDESLYFYVHFFHLLASTLLDTSLTFCSSLQLVFIFTRIIYHCKETHFTVHSFFQNFVQTVQNSLLFSYLQGLPLIFHDFLASIRAFCERPC